MSLTELDVFSRLESLRQQGDLGAAEDLLTNWAHTTGRAEDEWLAWSSLFTFALNEGHLDKASEYASHLIRLDASDAFAHSCIALVRKLQGSLREAEQEARIALDLAENS